MLRKSRNRAKKDNSFESFSIILLVTEEVYQADNQRRTDEAGLVDRQWQWVDSSSALKRHWKFVLATTLKPFLFVGKQRSRKKFLGKLSCGDMIKRHGRELSENGWYENHSKIFRSMKNKKNKNRRKPVLEQNKQYCRYATVFCRFLLGWSVCFLWKLCVYPVILSIALTTCGLGSHFIDFILKKLIISKKLCCQRSIIEASSCYFYFSLFRSRSHSRTGEIISVYRHLHTRVILRIFTTWRVFEKTQLWQVFKPRIPPFFRHVKG